MIAYNMPPTESILVEEVQADVYRTGPSASAPTAFWLSVWKILRRNRSGLSLPDLQLSEMTGIDVNWATDGGEPPNDAARENARTVLTVADILTIPSEYVTASAEGGVTICFNRNGVYADVECFNSGEIWALVSDRINPPATWAIKGNKRSIQAALRKISSAINPNA